MKTKLIAVLIASAISSGCASTSKKTVSDFLDGASSSAEKREQEESNVIHAKKNSPETDAIEDSMSGVFTALFRGIFGSE
ncbi:MULTISPECIES: hypothetical protein [Alteromonas]|jgi:TolA-binding protein|uniref:Lipoprotein n=1 Tax=Alteromonas stellipolaris TaxID=233316 RepID=A0AAW7Z0X6_9ALTE|nr:MULTISPECIES: hypothetical protein [Alteromonas]AMJ90977.1 hypothetical protein AV940_11140 [Alteromonas sp. Mac2]AMJ87115.1 hypothetical protein AV939_11375 [Alteromonas sp. Mac1]ANB22158.1 hypothetical protein A6K25_13280 [Alteromonas stellipolaris]MBZ2163355.1 hypothetical protein [Alteromonas stellipolaris]MDO6534433.1 hypothetical protein [Alteromonas stellipolaris]